MPYSIELHFNTHSNRQIQRIIDLLMKEKVNSVTIEQNIIPHLTLAVYDALDINEAINNLDSLRNKFKAFDLKLSGIGLFPSDEPPLFLIPKVTIELLTLHKYICELFDLYKNSQWQHYKPENWIPHCSVALYLSKKKIFDAIDIVIKYFQPFIVRIDRIVLTEFPPHTLIHRKKLPD